MGETGQEITDHEGIFQSSRTTLSLLGKRSELGRVDLDLEWGRKYLEHCRSFPEKLVVIRNMEIEDVVGWEMSEWIEGVGVEAVGGVGHMCELDCMNEEHPRLVSAERLLAGVWANGLTRDSMRYPSRTNWREAIRVPVLDQQKGEVLWIVMMKAHAVELAGKLEPIVVPEQN